MESRNRETVRVRLVFLLSFFGISIGSAFNTLYAKQMAETLPKTGMVEFYTTLPMTALMIMMLAGVLLSGAIARNVKSFDIYLRIAVSSAFLGMLIRGFSLRYWILLIGAGLHGFGYGLLFIGIRYYAYLFSGEESVHTLAFVNSGGFAGNCMGTIIGGMLAGTLPYRSVYLIAAGLLVLPYFLALRHPSGRILKVGRFVDVLKVFRNKKLLFLSLLIVLPMFACTAFTTYTVPLDADSFGYSATMISALLLGESILTAYLGPVMTSFMTKRVSKKTGLLLFCLMYAIPIALYAVFRNMPMLVLTMALLGVADAFGLNVLTDVFVHAKGKYDSNTALIAYMFVSRIGMVLAPTAIVAFGNPFWLGVMVAAGMILFILASFIFKPRNGKQESP